VEGFFDAINLWQAGYPAVALMGSSMSEAQATTIRAHWRKVILMLDGDEAGRAGTADILPRLAEHLFVRNIRLGDGLQPDKLTQQELWDMLPL
jgi:DNA primase